MDRHPNSTRLGTRSVPHRKAMLTLLAATKDIGISEAAVLAELVLS